MARYSLRLSSAEFFALTPRQFHLLSEERRKHLVHAEMMQAQTTAAIINYSLSAPEKPVAAIDLTFNYRLVEVVAPDDELERSIIQANMLVEKAAELKTGVVGPITRAVEAKKNA